MAEQQEDQQQGEDSEGKEQSSESDGAGGKQKDSKQEDSKQEGGEQKQQKRPRWPWFAAGFVVIVFTAIVLGIIFLPADSVWTNDAYVTAHYATIAPRISGQIATVDVEDNQPVHAGQVLATIDDRDYRATLAQSEAMLARDQAQAQDYAAQIARLPAQIEQQRSTVTSDLAQLAFAQANQKRYRDLAVTGAGTFQARQQADTEVRQAAAAVTGAQSAVAATERDLPVLEARRDAALATVLSDQAQVRQAQLNLSYTRILAPLDGSVTQRSVQVGNYVAPGAGLMALVPLGRVFVTANYREVALRHVRPGQHARIHVDAYDLYLEGVVDSLPPASGASFAPIQPNNATGNFTKIVQRLPVKVTMVPGQREALLLKEGFSVEVTIDTGHENVRAEQAQTPDRVTTP